VFPIFSMLLAMVFLITSNKASASTDIKIENSTGKNEVNVQSSNNSSITSESTSNISNHVEINGKTYVDDTSSSNGNYNSDINVNVHNNTGTVKYNVNGNEKTIQITPDDNNTSGSVNENKVSPEPTHEGKREPTDTQKPRANNVFQSMIKQIEDLFKNLSSLISSLQRR
jgi:hypothetical protein